MDGPYVPYLIGILIACAINILIMNLIKNPRDKDASPFCDIFSLPFFNITPNSLSFNSPSITSMFISFTIIYILLPMVYNPPNQVNIPFLIFLIAVLIIDVITQGMQKCFSYIGSVLGIIIGLILGAIWYAMIKSSGYDSLLYYTEYSGSNAVCKRPQKQYFKCDVYKNGELLTSTNGMNSS